MRLIWVKPGRNRDRFTRWSACRDRRNHLKRQHRDVVFLAEVLCGAGDGFDGFRAEPGRTLEPEELAAGVARFDDAVGDEECQIAFTKLDAVGWERVVGKRAQGQRAIER